MSWETKLILGAPTDPRIELRNSFSFNNKDKWTWPSGSYDVLFAQVLVVVRPPNNDANLPEVTMSMNGKAPLEPHDLHDLVKAISDAQKIFQTEQPYLESTRVVRDREYNPDYGNNRVCECGHPYHRHFDSYENMDPVGCKYCGCFTFVEAK